MLPWGWGVVTIEAVAGEDGQGGYSGAVDGIDRDVTFGRLLIRVAQQRKCFRAGLRVRSSAVFRLFRFFLGYSLAVTGSGGPGR